MVVIDDVSVVFDSHGRSVVALDHVSLRVAVGEFVCVVGPSGSGKSTLLRVVAGLLRQTSGTVHIERRAARHAAHRDGLPGARAACRS